MSSSSPENFDFIVNRRGGAVLKAGEEKIQKEILSRFGNRAGTFIYVDGSEIAAAVKTWVEKHAGQNRGLIIGGGDGTLTTAVEQVLGRGDVTLGILPLGTQNLIARQLGFSADFREAAAQYKTGESVEMDVGRINGMSFLIGITIDKNSLSFFEARENVRDNKLFPAFKKSLATASGLLTGAKNEFGISINNDGRIKKISGRMIAIVNNSLKPRPVRSFPYSGNEIKNIVARIMGKDNESTGKLSLYIFKGGLINVAAILPDILRGTWDRHKAVDTESAAQFIVHAGNDAQETSFTLDGELKKTQYPLDVSIIPKGLRIFKPR